MTGEAGTNHLAVVGLTRLNAGDEARIGRVVAVGAGRSGVQMFGIFGENVA